MYLPLLQGGVSQTMSCDPKVGREDLMFRVASSPATLSKFSLNLVTLKVT